MIMTVQMKNNRIKDQIKIKMFQEEFRITKFRNKVML